VTTPAHGQHRADAFQERRPLFRRHAGGGIHDDFQLSVGQSNYVPAICAVNGTFERDLTTRSEAP
jgi:hypothetical protein